MTNLVKELGIIRDGVGAGLMEKRPVCIPRYSFDLQNIKAVEPGWLHGNSHFARQFSCVTSLHVFNLTNASMHNVKK